MLGKIYHFSSFTFFIFLLLRKYLDHQIYYWLPWDEKYNQLFPRQSRCGWSVYYMCITSQCSKHVHFPHVVAACYPYWVWSRISRNKEDHYHNLNSNLNLQILISNQVRGAYFNYFGRMTIHGCRFIAYFEKWLFLTSMFHLTAISFER